jgi:hypothetical protein
MNSLRYVFIIVLALTVISCNKSKKSKDQEKTIIKEHSFNISKKESLFHAKVLDFVYNIHEKNEDLNILNIELSEVMNCSSDSNLRLCDAVGKYINGNNIVFSALEEFADLIEDADKYRMLHNGLVKIGDNSYDAQLYYSTYGDKNISFYGQLVIYLPMLELLDGNPLLIEVKGKKK